MPRYVVERTFPEGLHIPVNVDGAQVCLAVVGRNTDEGVTWVHICQRRQAEDVLRLRRAKP